MSFDDGPRIDGDHHYALLEHCATQAEGTFIEFGVGKGESTRILAQRAPTIGFDSFAGLPEDWRDGYPRGMFAHNPPTIPNVRLVIGWYETTLPGFTFPDNIGLVHFDADLYSSTHTALKYIGPHLKPGCFLVFDEFFNYPGCEHHEQKAWQEFVNATGIRYRVVGHGHHESWGIQIA